MPRYERFARVEVLVPHETYERLGQMLPTKKISPTIRRMVEEYVAQEEVRRRIETMREAGDG